jgi:phospholipid/cholesterol/gamma-HCH transport system substrate-binding protein
MGAHCYSAPFGGIKLNDGAGSPYPPVVPLTTSASAGSGQGAGSLQVPAGGLGLPNSPQENELVNELLAPGLNVPPGQLPSWSSVLLGPLYRGKVVSVG